MQITFSKIGRSDVGLFGIANRQGIEELVGRALPVIQPIGRGINLRLIPATIMLTLAQLLRYRSLSQISFLIRVSYISSGIRKMRARTVVTYVDESCEFYFLKWICPGVVFAAIQNGHRGPFPLFDTLRKFSRTGLPKPWCDAIFVWTEGFGDKYRELINAEVIVTGSLLNNQAPRRQGPTIGKQLAFVSTYFPFDQLVTEFEKQVENVVRRHTQEVLKVARSWCAENGYEIVVLGRFPGAEETEFFRQCLKQEPVFPKWDPKLRNIVNLDSADLVLSCLSSLGLESVGRGCKTAICWPPAAFSSSFNSNIEWFSGLGDYGPFWTSSVSELEIRRVLDFVGNCSRYDWKTLETEYSSKFCHFDPDNVIIRGKLQALISK